MESSSKTHVTYTCGCGLAWPLERLYFCPRCPDESPSVLCPDLRCCTSEIDTYYCPGSLDNYASADASTNKYKSYRHFDCPECGHALHVAKDANGRSSFRCRHCRWSSAPCGLVAEAQEELIAAAIAREAVPGADRALSRLATLAEDEAQRRLKSSGRATSGGGFASGGGAYRSRSSFASGGRYGGVGFRARGSGSGGGGGVSTPRPRHGAKKWRVPDMHAALDEKAARLQVAVQRAAQPDLVADWRPAVLWGRDGAAAVTLVGHRGEAARTLDVAAAAASDDDGAVVEWVATKQQEKQQKGAGSGSGSGSGTRSSTTRSSLSSFSLSSGAVAAPTAPRERDGYSLISWVNTEGSAVATLFGGYENGSRRDDVFEMELNSSEGGGAWTRKLLTSGTPPTARSGHSAVTWRKRGGLGVEETQPIMTVFGGWDQAFCADVHELDLTARAHGSAATSDSASSSLTNQWHRVRGAKGASRPPPRACHSAIVYEKPLQLQSTAGSAAATAPTMVIFGGWDGIDFRSDVWELDLLSGRWTELATSCGGGKNQLSGGESGTSSSSSSSGESGSAGPTPRWGHAAAIIIDQDDALNHTMVVMGGYDALAVQGDVWTLDLVNGIWSRRETRGAAPSPRLAHTALTLAPQQSGSGGTILVVGGFDGENASEEVYSLDSVNWTWTQLVAREAAAEAAAAAVGASLAQQLLQPWHQPSSTTALLPLRRPLRVKCSRRCRVCYAAGNDSGGIVIKPEINPSAGDTQFRAHIGKWHKKANLAYGFLPRIRIVRIEGREATATDVHGDATGADADADADAASGACAVVLRLTNPAFTKYSSIESDVTVRLLPLPSDFASPIVITMDATLPGAEASITIGGVESEEVRAYDQVAARKTAAEDGSCAAVVERLANAVFLRIPLTALPSSSSSSSFLAAEEAGSAAATAKGPWTFGFLLDVSYDVVKVVAPSGKIAVTVPVHISVN